MSCLQEEDKDAYMQENKLSELELEPNAAAETDSAMQSLKESTGACPRGCVLFPQVTPSHHGQLVRVEGHNFYEVLRATQSSHRCH